MWIFDQAFGAEPSQVGARSRRGAFLDLIALVMENCSEKKIYGRGPMPGLAFPRYNLKTSYPEHGATEILIEARVSGSPKLSRHPQQKRGRPGSWGLGTWVKEAGLKTIDLKAEWARNAGQGGGPTSDLVSWLRQSKPRAFLFLAIRVVDRKDFERTLFFADAAS
jgi:hypothetical protein